MIARKGDTVAVQLHGFDEATQAIQRAKLTNALVGAETTGILRVRSLNWTEDGAKMSFTVLRNPFWLPLVFGAALGGLGFTWVGDTTETIIHETIGGGGNGGGGGRWGLAIVAVGAVFATLWLFKGRR